MAPATRRWFRFSLRTMFVAMTVIAVVIGYHVKWVHDRHVVINGSAPLGEKFFSISYDTGFQSQAWRIRMTLIRMAPDFSGCLASEATKDASWFSERYRRKFSN